MRYYADAENGNDANDGRSWRKAVKTLEEICRRAEPGDRLYLRGTFHEPLKPQVSGTFDRPIRVYGPAIIDTLGMGYAVELRGTQHWSFRRIHCQTMSDAVTGTAAEKPYGVLITRQAMKLRFSHCTFRNAGLGTERSPVEIFQSTGVLFRRCVSICGTRGGLMYGKRAWLICGSSFVELFDCANYGGSLPSPAGSETDGAGVGVTIYGAEFDGYVAPCAYNLVYRHRSFWTRMYAFGVASGPAWCTHNRFIDCVAYCQDGGFAGMLTALSGSAGQNSATLSEDNQFRRCTIFGKVRYGARIRGLDARVVDCIAPDAERFILEEPSK